MPEQRILLLGVGNLLYADEGVGVHAARHLERNYTFSGNVTLLEGGTRGRLLMGSIADCDRLVVMDAVLGGGPPGALYRLEDDDLRKSLGFHDSQHQVDLVDVLIGCGMMDSRPAAVVLGMEPMDWKSLRLELSPVCAAAFPRFISEILRELAAQGGRAFPREARRPSGEEAPWGDLEKNPAAG
ncbi:MAG: HyaD/HybD family hydrogenase maturation endopeptidase [Desulfovibrio sp.]|jgi:hydrogenase maturation protease|nr:HyaD/HybD family hydrogenase maturation endopeptidase [Desulfovibrio sp.]